MRSIFDRLTRTLVRRGIREGFFAGDGKWAVLGAAAWLVRFLMKKREPKVIVEHLGPGESLTVSSVPPPLRGRKKRKATRRETQAGEPRGAT
ncbi:MAG: hypothetical protein ACRDZP_06005 [Acidimicrobiales bacterium]